MAQPLVSSTLWTIVEFDDFVKKIKNSFDLNDRLILDSLKMPSPIIDSVSVRLEIQQKRQQARDEINEIVATMNLTNEAKVADDERKNLGLTIDMPAIDFDFELQKLQTRKKELEKMIITLNEQEKELATIDKEFILRHQEAKKLIEKILISEGYVVQEGKLGHKICRIANLVREKFGIEDRMNTSQKVAKVDKKKVKDIEENIVNELISATNTKIESLTKAQKKKLIALLNEGGNK
jgi:hypothetical protein